MCEICRYILILDRGIYRYILIVKRWDRPEGDEIMESYETIEILDENEETGETLYSIKTVEDLTISVIVAEDGTEYYNDDWQGYQPKSFDEVYEGCWNWYAGDQIDLIDA